MGLRGAGQAPVDGYDATAPLLTYTLETDPAPLQVAQGPTPTPQTLRITVTHHGNDEVTVEEIRFSFPVGLGPDDLTASPENAEPQVDDNRRWRFEYEEDSQSYVLTPLRNRPLDPGDQLELTIASVGVNREVGTSRLTLAEKIEEGGETRYQEWPLAKVPAGFTVGDFRPEYVLVQSGRSAELTWRGDSRPGATYTMLHDGEPADVTAVRRWVSPALHRDTAFALVVRVRDEAEGAKGGDGDAAEAEYALTTLVTVARPDLVVNDLTVRGRATLTRLPVEFGLGEADERVCTAETDGFLVGHLIAEEDVAGDGAPTLTVTVSADGADRRTSVQARQAPPDPGDPGFPGVRLTAVVPRGAVVTIGRSGTAASRYRLAWLPFGTGELKEPAGGAPLGPRADRPARRE
ncbi:hypothetical protein [Streptomyces sp. NPDC090022]|uniref:hypothetical protein n=1 Tax=Streptomyces sp. NPDC090022 TaxID=3365920 RepID=UPI00381E2997